MERGGDQVEGSSTQAPEPFARRDAGPPEKPAAEPRRIARFLQDVGKIGNLPEGGWTRLAFGLEERRAHEIFREWAGELGMEVSTDAVGNTFAELGARLPGPALVAGSHLDTVPSGGNFDGTSGVAAALEAGRLLSQSGPLRHPYRVVAFTGEEGSRFGTPCIGSRLVTGAFTAATLESLMDSSGATAAACAREVGLEPDRADSALWEPGSVAAFLELHIEQGRVLESQGLSLGIVDSIAGSTRLELTLSGRADHSGATPMRLRSDALAGAGEIVLDAESRALGYRTAVATVGRIDITPGSFTTVPGTAKLSLDVRDIDSDRQRELAEEILGGASKISGRRGLELTAELVSDQSPVILHKPVRERLAAAASARGLNFRVLASGASHDAAHLASITPTGMLFVPSREGISHSPEEWSAVEHIACGAEVIADTVRLLDARGKERGGDDESNLAPGNQG